MPESHFGQENEKKYRKHDFTLLAAKLSLAERYRVQISPSVNGT
jgi:hypothetical protein